MEYNPYLPDLTDSELREDALANRLRKNYKHLRKWAKRSGSDAFRLYDRDIPGINVAIDYYAGRLCIQYYSKIKDEHPDDAFTASVTASIEATFGDALKQVVWKYRIKRDKFEQYEKHDEKNENFIALENGIPFIINITDYLDNGLFLDHRQTREMVMKDSSGKRVMNLFSYTSSFSVYAAKGGASATLSVDMSNKYTAWSRDNLALNGFNEPAHTVLREDCIKFLKEYRGKKFDIIIIDPPTISRSAKMESMFDVNRDYIFLVKKALDNLSDQGYIMFSTNSRTIKADFSALPVFVREITPGSIPFGFHDTRIHRAWIIRKVL